ncbi:MAG: hypothetical protein KKE86_08300 [Planctomycetes bacterium]|nr:hypothetical protein [Planctomycetota bacterium]MBU4399321.1 hypothetical protein [Planctomycetota bacterium]MCG2685267.1 hypothetical protein [Planctomycetales bacterium]
MSQVNVNIAWSAVRAILENNFSFNTIKEIMGLAGFDVTNLSHLEQRSGGGASKGQLMTAIDRDLVKVLHDDKRHLINILVEEIVQRRPDLEGQLEKYLERLGWQIIEGNAIPIEILDKSDLPELPSQAKTDLIKAASRFRDGDLSGSLGSACAAIDSVTSDIYTNRNLGDPGVAAFQERCTVAIKNSGLMMQLSQELHALGWEERRVKPLIENFRGALNQAAYIMQSLRAQMSDVHGTKPALRSLVFDSVKFAAILVRAMNDA